MNAFDIGSAIKVVSGKGGRAVAAGAGDATEVDGFWIDRRGYQSCKAGVVGSAVLTEAATITVAFNLQDADDAAGANAADYGDAHAAAIAATGGTGGTTEPIAVADSFNLSSARRYIRIQHTPNLSAGATDTSTVAGVIVLGGANAEPAV